MKQMLPPVLAAPQFSIAIWQKFNFLINACSNMARNQTPRVCIARVNGLYCILNGSMRFRYWYGKKLNVWSCAHNCSIRFCNRVCTYMECNLMRLHRHLLGLCSQMPRSIRFINTYE